MATDDPRAQAIETNVSAFLLDMGRVGGGAERRDSEVVWTVGGSPLDYHNAVVHCDVEPSRADALIDEWIAELGALRLPGSWHVSPSMRPLDLAGRLIQRGFSDGGEEPAMTADLTTAPPETPTIDGFEVETVVDDAGLDTYRQVLASGFGEGPKEASWVAEVFRRIGLADDAAWRHYVGRLDAQPVCTTSLFLTPPVAGIYFVSTAADFRRRGLGTAITRHSMLEAGRLGCTTAVLGSSPMGYGVYRQLGFEEVFRYRVLEWSPAEAA